MPYNVLVFLSFFESVIGFALMSSTMMKFKSPVKKHILIGFSVMVLGISLLSYTLFTKGIYSVDEYAVFVILLIELSWFLICSDDRLSVTFFMYLSFVNVYIFISFFSDYLSLNFENGDFVGIHMLLRLLIYLAIIPLLYKYVREQFRLIVDILNKEWLTAILVPLFFLIMQSMILYYPAPYWHWAQDSWLRVVILTAYLLYVLIYSLLYLQSKAIVEKYALEKRELLMAQQEKLWESELLSQQESTALVLQQKHDLHHHNAVILEMLQNGDTESLVSYLTSADSSLEKSHTVSFCAHPISNSIFNIYNRRAQAEGIKISFQVQLPKTMEIDNIDLTCVLGNALENALEGCMRLPGDEEKEILVKAKFIDSRLRIQVVNNCRPDILFEDELPMTQKQGGGTGIKSIIYTAEHYDGATGFSVSEGRFITQIVLNEKCT